MNETLQLIAAISTAITAIISAVFAGLAMLHAAKAKAESSKANEQIAVVKGEVHKIELATNSMKDALVAGAGAAGLLQGAADERARADAEKAGDIAGRAAQVADDLKHHGKLSVIQDVGKPSDPLKADDLKEKEMP